MHSRNLAVLQDQLCRRRGVGSSPSPLGSQQGTSVGMSEHFLWRIAGQVIDGCYLRLAITIPFLLVVASTIEV